jgi:hypothetical protein
MKKRVAMLIVVLVAVASSPVLADMILTQKTVMEAMGMGGTEMVTTQKIKGQMDYMSVTMTGAGMMAAAPATQSIVINRMDKGVIWMLNPATKTYTEFPHATLKAMAGAAMAERDSLPGQESNWTVTVDTLAESTINGYACTGIKGVAEGAAADEPGKKTRITFEVWVSKNLPGSDELIKHYQQLADLTGQDAYSQNEMISQMLGEGKPELRKLTDAARGMNGFPVRTVVTVAASADFGKELDAETGDDSETVAMKEQMKALITGQAGEDGMTTVVSMQTNMTKIEVAPVEATIFEIPEGFTKGY